VNNFPDNLDDDLSVRAAAKTTIRIVGGGVLMLLGVATIVGGIIMHFAEKAERFVLFPFAGRLTIVVGLGISIAAVALAGARAAIAFGSVVLVVGIGMFIFGYSNLPEPSLRFYAPLGFFVSLAGGFFIWGGREFLKEAAKEAARKPESKPDPLE
jgi:hypothetical protein